MPKLSLKKHTHKQAKLDHCTFGIQLEDIGGFRSVLCVSVFQGLLLVIAIMIDGREKHNFMLHSKFQSLHVIEKRGKRS